MIHHFIVCTDPRKKRVMYEAQWRDEELDKYVRPWTAQRRLLSSKYVQYVPWCAAPPITGSQLVSIRFTRNAELSNWLTLIALYKSSHRVGLKSARQSPVTAPGSQNLAVRVITYRHKRNFEELSISYNNSIPRPCTVSPAHIVTLWIWSIDKIQILNICKLTGGGFVFSLVHYAGCQDWCHAFWLTLPKNAASPYMEYGSLQTYAKQGAPPCDEDDTVFFYNLMHECCNLCSPSLIQVLNLIDILAEGWTQACVFLGLHWCEYGKVSISVHFCDPAFLFSRV